MERNVLTWNQALAAGFQPGLYPFIATLVPTGELEAVLDFKVWAKKTMGICCYFTHTETARKFQLTVYRRKSDERYMLDACEIDFTTCETGASYMVSVEINGKGNIAFGNAWSV
jgi:3,4-dihydroxy-2-butanone 4-phosphate synthase